MAPKRDGFKIGFWRKRWLGLVCLAEGLILILTPFEPGLVAWECERQMREWIKFMRNKDREIS